ncbi:MAG TPA: hypothetical protein VHP33_18105, partial [Polyangiaceae bacterium]|nr:hypothetical protein [Polyangiaceae bacterium]
HVVASSRFQGLLASMPKESRDCWRLLEGLSTGHIKDRDPMAEALCRIRNSGAFHYYQPKSLADAFRGAFYERSAGARTDKAYASFGVNLEGTRFHYADAAAEVLLQKQAAGAGVASYKSEFQTLLFAVNNALFSLVCRYLADRSERKPPRPPLRPRGGSKANRKRRK